MASSFEIFEDRENLNERTFSSHGDVKRERVMLGPLTNNPIGNENPTDQLPPKTSKSSEILASSRAFKDKNFCTKNDGKIKLKESSVDEEETINITTGLWQSSSDCLEVSSSVDSFTYRKDIRDDELATPMSIAESGTPMSIDDKSAMEIEQMRKSMAIKSDRDRCFEVAEYQKDILKYLKLVEVQKNIRPRADYMVKQPDINDSMRSILVDWLVEVSEEYRLHSETLCLAVHYIDRFLSFMSVVRAKLQLVGTTAMFIASKYEEIYPQDISEFVYITDDTYSKQQVLRMEKLLLKVLSFDLNCPTSYCFINLFATAMNIPDKVKFMAQYLCELTMLRAIPFLSYTPSLLSSAALALSYYTHGNSIWNSKMQETFGYELDELKEVLVQLSHLHIEADSLPQQAIQEKYKTNKYMQTSCVKPKKITREEIDDILAKLNMGDELNTTAENIENVRQKAEMVFNIV